ncbi:MAG: hypothetical protein ABSG98_11340 [Anaerolineales bacterium]|jgi:hypothetical protein
MTELELAQLAAERLAGQKVRLRFRAPSTARYAGVAYKSEKGQACIDLDWEADRLSHNRVFALVHEAMHLKMQGHRLDPSSPADYDAAPEKRINPLALEIADALRKPDEDEIEEMTSRAFETAALRANEHWRDGETWACAALRAIVEAPAGSLPTDD